MTRNTSRRRFLKAVAATGAVTGINATVLAQDGTETQQEGQAEEYILLGGNTAGWQGYRLPGQAEAGGEANPTLNLQSGTTYILMWQNVDGQPHNFAIQDSEGNNLEVLEPISVQQDTFQQINETAPDETVSPEVNQTMMGGNETMMGGNQTEGDQTTTTMQSLIAKTETLSEQGAVQGVRFTASEEMNQYICLVHPNSMVGDIQLEGGGGGTETTTEEM